MLQGPRCKMLIYFSCANRDKSARVAYLCHYLYFIIDGKIKLLIIRQDTIRNQISNYI